ncbi:MAG: pilus assembly protein PilM [Candidatus Marinimicrobia bacterium]|nr:pilus assembly protein PilM [Candidatus Neomarinimicrobiota bacterium]
MSSDGKRELATNRLLDILRAQQSETGKKDEAPIKEKPKEEPIILDEPENVPDSPSKFSLLIPDPNRFGAAPKSKPNFEPKLSVPESDGTVQENIQSESLESVPMESEPEFKETDSTKPTPTPTQLEESPGLTALRKKLGITKNSHEEVIEDKRPVDIFKETETETDTDNIKEKSKEHLSINDLIKSSKKANINEKSEQTDDGPAEEAELKNDTSPLFGKKEKPLSEFFKRGTETEEKSEDTPRQLFKSSISQKLDQTATPSKPDAIDEDSNSSAKEEKPLREFFKRGTVVDKQENEEKDQELEPLSGLKPEKTSSLPEIAQEAEATIKSEEKVDEALLESADVQTDDVSKTPPPEEKSVGILQPTPIEKELEKTEDGIDTIPDIKNIIDKKTPKTKKSLFSSIFKKTKSKSQPLEVTEESPVSSEPEAVESSASGTLQEVAPESFNESLITFLEVEDYKFTLTDYFNSFMQRFDESLQKLAIVTDEQSLLMLLVSSGLKGFTVDSYKYYKLPLKLNERTIKNPDDLLNYVLSHELKEKQKKILYGAYFSTKMQTKTQVLQSPDLSRKELTDLVDWNSKKNLPFPADQSISNWEMPKTEDKSKKREVVIGVMDSKSINTIYNIFTRNNVRLRFTSTLPILLWKTFIKNYPDRKNQCNVLIHLGEIHTIVLVIQNHKLLFVREIAIGTHDFYKSIMVRIETKDKSTTDIDFDMARDITHQYGFPKNAQGFTVGSKVNLYKLAIFQRPVIERISGELGRSLNYFKKQNPELIWEELVFNGEGATLPNFVETLRDNLNIDVSLLNPIRTSKVHYSSLPPIPKYLLPNFAINFSLVSDEVRNLNLMPPKVRSDHKNILFSKIAGIAVGIFIPFVAISTFLSALKIDTYTERINILEMEKNNTLSQTKEYIDLKGDIEIIQAYQNYITNDRIASYNKIKLLKILSNSIPDEIKITELLFKKKYSNINPNDTFDPFIVRPEYFIEMTGFVISDVSIANIQLANFRVGLQNKSYFKSITVLREDISASTNGKLLFTMEIKY